jgi:hypothetical protein
MQQQQQQQVPYSFVPRHKAPGGLYPPPSIFAELPSLKKQGICDERDRVLFPGAFVYNDPNKIAAAAADGEDDDGSAAAAAAASIRPGGGGERWASAQHRPLMSRTQRIVKQNALAVSRGRFARRKSARKAARNRQYQRAARFVGQPDIY